jgi:flavin-dependent dehydrogenase
MRTPLPAAPPPRAAQVIVVGGGPAGSSAAWHLAQAGLDVLLLDRARFPRSKPCAEYLSPEGARVLHAMGALEQLERDGAALAGMVVRAPDGGRIHGEFAAQHGFRGFRDRGLGVRRERLDAVLLERARAAGVRVLEAAKVDDLSRGAHGDVDGVVVRTETGRETLRASLVIGADGLRSVVARRLGLARTARWPRRLALVAHYEGVADMSALGEMHVAPDGYVGLASVADGPGRTVTNVALVVPMRAARAIEGDRAGFLQGWLARQPQLAPRFAGARRVSPVRATGPFASKARRPWAPGALLTGDAADFFDPFTGEGIYAALLGGELLVPAASEAVIAREAGRTAGMRHALAGYAAERRRAFAGKWRVERLIGAAVAVPALMNRAARVLGRDRDLADLLVGVTGDFVPPAAVLRPGTLWRLLVPRRAPA